MSSVNFSRRKFLQSSALVGGGLIVGFSMTGCSDAPSPIVQESGGLVPNAFIQITPQNVIRFYCPRDEMGQGVTTGLGTLIAEELDVLPTSLDIVFAGAHSDYNNPDFGAQLTGGSTSMKAHYQPLRQAAANTRALLLDAAAKDLGVALDAITTTDRHIVVNGEQHPYSKFIATATTLEIPAEAPLKNEKEFNYIGKEFPRIDAIAKATGTAEYGIDVEVPGMHHAVVRRSPVPGAKLLSVDTTAVKKLPGVTDVIEISSGIAVVAQKFWQAKSAAATLDPQWEEVALTKIDSKTIRADYQTAMKADDELTEIDEGDLELGFSGAEEVIENEYWAPFLAHAPLEPMNAVLRIENGEADLWSGNQAPTGVQGLVTRFSGIPAEKVRVHNSFLGGGFGRRATLSHIVEVTEIAVATDKPIHLLWTREDDMKHGVYRPASLMKLKAGVSKEGDITAWQARRVGGNITPRTLENMIPALLPGLGDGTADFITGLAGELFQNWIVDYTSIEGLSEDYDMPNKQVSHVTVEHGIPLTFWRSVGHSYTAFAAESMIDELAEKANKDPVEFRLSNTKNNARLNNVIRVAGEKMKQMKPAKGHHLGFASHNSFFTDVAEIAEVSVENGKIKVHKVTCVVDCGIAVNPDIVRAQIEGAVMFGLTAALYGSLEVEGGAIKESNFHDYPILRMDEAPLVEVIIIDSGTEPTGIGEPGLPPIAPAVANAVYRATGQRLRSLPLTLEA